MRAEDTSRDYKSCQLVKSGGRLVCELDRSSSNCSQLILNWIPQALNCNVSEQGDPVLRCVFKTEMVATLLTLTQAGMGVNIAPTITYNKKKDKAATVKFQPGAGATETEYKSATVQVPAGQPATSVSRPMPPRKPRPKAVKKNNPATAAASKRAPAARQLPGASKPPPPAILSSTPAAAPAKKVNGFKAAPTKAAPPPPPPHAPAQPVDDGKDWHTALYNFAGQPGELSLKKGEKLEVRKKEGDWWECVRENGEVGWAPSNYLKPMPKPKAPPAPPRAPPRAPPAAPAAPLAPALPAAATSSASNGSQPRLPSALAASIQARQQNASAPASTSSTPASSRPNSMMMGSGKAPPPAIPKKAGPPAIPGKPAVPKAKPASTTPPGDGGVGKAVIPAAAPGGGLSLADA